VLVVTVQNRQFIDKYLAGEEVAPRWERSVFVEKELAVLERTIVQEGKRKGIDLSKGMFWAWARNPFYEFQQKSAFYDEEAMDVLILDLPVSELVLSDFDVWNEIMDDVLLGNGVSFKDVARLFNVNLIRDKHCVQACFGGFRKEQVVDRIRYVDFLKSLSFVRTFGVYE
jgi:hypothetical protein